MDMLSGFDFGAADHVPNAFEYNEIPLEHMQLLSKLEEASKNKNLPTVVQTFGRLRQSSVRSDILRKPGGALRLAVESGDRDTVQYLLSEGVQISANHVKIATTTRAKPILQLLLQYGWPINKRLGWSDPPALAYAVENQDMTEWLLFRGSDPNAPCGLDKTPLSAAVQYASLDVIQMLFASGGSVNHGQLLHYAIWRDRGDRSAVVRYLLEMGAPVNVVMYYDKPDSYLQREAFGLGTPLHDAAAMGDMDVLQILIDKGADIRVRDTRGHLAHERAQANNHASAAQFLLSKGVEI